MYKLLDWKWLSQNSAIITLDYDWLKKRMDVIREELMCTVMHPSRIAWWLEQGIDVDEL